MEVELKGSIRNILEQLPNLSSKLKQHFAGSFQNLTDFHSQKNEVVTTSVTLKSFKKAMPSLLTFSLPSLKKRFTDKYKKIFGYLYEKSNLLVRLDNNTGFFFHKILQTTTI